MLLANGLACIHGKDFHMRFRAIFAVAAMLVAGTFASANASPLTYKLTSMFDGSIGGTAVTGAMFTWTITSDTSLVGTSFPGVFDALALSDTINVTGFGTLTPTGPSAFFNVPSIAEEAFFSNATLGTGIVFGAPSLAGYFLTSSIGPTPVILVNFGPTPTDQGDLIINNTTSLVFQATGVPEPLTLALFGAGLAGIGALRRRKQKA